MDSSITSQLILFDRTISNNALTRFPDLFLSTQPLLEEMFVRSIQ
jgi:hypothetical protein